MPFWESATALPTYSSLTAPMASYWSDHVDVAGSRSQAVALPLSLSMALFPVLWPGAPTPRWYEPAGRPCRGEDGALMETECPKRNSGSVSRRALPSCDHEDEAATHLKTMTDPPPPTATADLASGVEATDAAQPAAAAPPTVL